MEKVIVSAEAKSLGLKTTYSILKGVSIKKSHSELDTLKKDLRLVPHEERLAAMRKAYASFGVDSKKRAPSAEALINRIREGKPLYNINTLVDVYNLVSIKHSLPMAAYDLSHADFPITLRPAKEGEEITLIGGDKKKVKPGEIVYSDASKLVCLDFNYRDCDSTKITENTQDIIVFVDGCPGISDEEMSDALSDMIGMIIRFNGGKVTETALVK